MSVGYRDSWAAHGRRVFIHIGRSRISWSDHQLARRRRTLSSFAMNSFFTHDNPFTGSVLDTLEEAGYPQAVQRWIHFVLRETAADPCWLSLVASGDVLSRHSSVS